MKNLKREYKLLLILFLLLITGWLLNIIMVAHKQENTQKIAQELDDKKAQLLRDQQVNQKINLSKLLYNANIKSNENYNVVTIPFLDRIQNLLEQSAIKVNPQDISQVGSTSEVVENGLAFYSFDVSFSTEYPNLKKFLKNLERDKYFFDVVSINVNKIKSSQSAPVLDAAGVPVPQPVTRNTSIKVGMRIQITKFI